MKNKKGFKLYYETDFVDLKKPVLFFVHGLGGDTDAWRFIRDDIKKKGLNFVAMDVLGHGYSDHPRGFSSYNFDDLAQDVLSVMDKEKIKKVVLVGHCYGAVIAMNFAIKYPDRLKKLVLISGTYRPPYFIFCKAIRILMSGVSNLAALISPKPYKPCHSKYPVGKFHKDFEFIGLAKTLAHNSLRSYLLLFKEVVNLDLEHSLFKIKTPTLVMVGDKDSIFQPSISKKIHKSISKSKFKIIKGGNHVVVLNNANEVSKLICDFVYSSSSLH